MYRERDCQRKAVEMYSSGKMPDQVIQMLLREGANKKLVVSLADKFYRDYVFLLNEKRRQKRKNAQRNSLAGGVLLISGLLLTLLNYLSTGRGPYLLFYGLTFVGVVLLVKATVAKNQHSLKLK
jgi:hypothetical protein